MDPDIYKTGFNKQYTRVMTLYPKTNEQKQPNKIKVVFCSLFVDKIYFSKFKTHEGKNHILFTVMQSFNRKKYRNSQVRGHHNELEIWTSYRYRKQNLESRKSSTLEVPEAKSSATKDAGSVTAMLLFTVIWWRKIIRVNSVICVMRLSCTKKWIVGFALLFFVCFCLFVLNKLEEAMWLWDKYKFNNQVIWGNVCVYVCLCVYYVRYTFACRRRERQRAQI